MAVSFQQSDFRQLFVKAEPSVLENIECGTYTLHPSVSNPVRNVCVLGESDRAFAAHSQGLRATASVLPLAMKASGCFAHCLMPSIMP